MFSSDIHRQALKHVAHITSQQNILSTAKMENAGEFKMGNGELDCGVRVKKEKN